MKWFWIRPVPVLESPQLQNGFGRWQAANYGSLRSVLEDPLPSRFQVAAHCCRSFAHVTGGNGIVDDLIAVFGTGQT